MDHSESRGATILAELADEGFRITNLRRALIELMSQLERPFSIDEIRHLLEKKGMPTYRGSLYREMESLAKVGIIEHILFHDGVLRYELLDRAHHHHLVCLSCNNVEDVELKQELDNEEKRIARKTKFQIIRHSLEFFGLCANCRS